jgi:hypothetical protein
MIDAASQTSGMTNQQFVELYKAIFHDLGYEKGFISKILLFHQSKQTEHYAYTVVMKGGDFYDKFIKGNSVAPITGGTLIAELVRDPRFPSSVENLWTVEHDPSDTEILKINKINKVIIESVRVKPDDDILSQIRVGKPAGAYYIDKRGRTVLRFALGSDKTAGAQGVYLVFESRISMSDLKLIQRDLSMDPEVRSKAYADYHLRLKESKNGSIHSFFHKMKDILIRICRVLSGKGYRTWQDIFFEISTGKIKLADEPLNLPKSPVYFGKVSMPSMPSEEEILAAMNEIEGNIKNMQEIEGRNKNKEDMERM